MKRIFKFVIGAVALFGIVEIGSRFFTRRSIVSNIMDLLTEKFKEVNFDENCPDIIEPGFDNDYEEADEILKNKP